MILYESYTYVNTYTKYFLPSGTSGSPVMITENSCKPIPKQFLISTRYIPLSHFPAFFIFKQVSFGPVSIWYFFPFLSISPSLNEY